MHFDQKIIYFYAKFGNNLPESAVLIKNICPILKIFATFLLPPKKCRIKKSPA